MALTVRPLPFLKLIMAGWSNDRIFWANLLASIFVAGVCETLFQETGTGVWAVNDAIPLLPFSDLPMKMIL